jgi:hypothetical protein
MIKLTKPFFFLFATVITSDQALFGGAGARQKDDRWAVAQRRRGYFTDEIQLQRATSVGLQSPQWAIFAH